MRRALILALGTALFTAGLAAVAAPAMSAPAKVAEVDPTISPKGWVAPKNAMGQPDLSGYWSNATMTPLTRNPKLTDKLVVPKEQAASLEKVFAAALAAADAPTDQKKGPGAVTDPNSPEAQLVKIRPDFAAAGGDVGGYNTFWIDPGNHMMEVNGEYRSSIITTPNGMPPARKTGAPAGGRGYRDVYDSYENRSLGERCIMGFGANAGPPMLANGYYNNNYYIQQSPDAVVIQVELIHDARIVRLKGGHRTDGVRQWMGDSIGHFEGPTLVVETTNIPQGQAFIGSWKNLKVTERFTRVSPTRINYQFQVEDPDTWDKPWGGEYDFTPLHGIVYEYACHEGNYALPAILAGARRQEQEAAAAKAKPGAE
ncbi:hypothetical protein [Phenylobacterium sp.]|jgi:hypothetical protein|uniref:hypothetical protein n=1 Tax=Phenylobacterium sp. TaxID=1871053 RepID=UPI002E37BA28|nr:hypothetical protein [Phenylobacterium sp.]HEX3366530.1 hypothetical protein [Phenylobacterium sp.]